MLKLIKEDVNKEEKAKACEAAINDLIQNFWNIVSETNAIATTCDYELEKDQKEEVSKILNSVIDDVTVNIGMLYKVIDILNDKTLTLLDAGQEKAEDILADAQEDKENTTDEIEEKEETLLVEPVAND